MGPLSPERRLFTTHGNRRSGDSGPATGSHTPRKTSVSASRKMEVTNTNALS